MEEQKDLYLLGHSKKVRLEILVQEAQKEELERLSRELGRSIGDLCREGISVILTVYGGVR